MAFLNDINFQDKKALIRVDFNVPLNNEFEVTDNTRIKAAIPTINYILQQGGAVILMSHLGRPDGVDAVYSLSHIVSELNLLLNRSVIFCSMKNEEITKEACSALVPGEVLLLENLRFDKREKSGDSGYALFLSSLADVYVNDAFGTAHRAHASTAVIAKYVKEKCFGLLMQKEIESLNKVMNQAEKEVTAIIGGAKVSSKIEVISNLLEKVDNLIIGGGMAYTFIKSQGGLIGNSLIEEDKLAIASDLINQANKNEVKIYLPIDSVCSKLFSNDAESQLCKSANIPDGFMGLDIGIEAIEEFKNVISNSKTILWNGPMGVFEFDNFSNGTIQIAQELANATSNGSYTLVGGGDSVAALKKFNLMDSVSYVSTGGGAMLEFMEGKTLPGIAAITN